MDFLRGTIDPNQRANAEEQLKQVEKIIGVAPTFLQIIMSSEIEMPIRQAGAIYLKNMIQHSWSEADESEEPRFHIHEQDRALLRDQIVDAVVMAPTPIRSQLCVCIGIMCKSDFPGRWTSLVDKICIYLQSQEVGAWHGTLSALLSLVKVFEYKKGNDRQALDEAMNLLLPMVQTLMVNHLMNDTSQPVLAIQRIVLKIFFAMTHHHLPLTLLTQDKFGQWMEIVRLVLDRTNPEFEVKPTDEDDKVELEMNEWWKTKKWAMRILYRMFERYGSPGGVTKEYKSFSTWYLNTFSGGALQVVFKIMDSYRNGSFVADKVMRDGLLYLKNAVSHAHAWKFIKPHCTLLLSDVIYPLMCHTDADETLWKEDPIEYVKLKYADILEEDSVVSCGEQLLNAMCKKRKGVLPKCLGIVNQVLNEPNSSPKQKDGAFHMIGAIADILLKKEQFKTHFEDVLMRFVFPAFNTSFPFLRARSAWLLSKLSTLRFSNDDILQGTIGALIGALLNKEEEMPVKVEAAFAIEAFLHDQHKSHVFIQAEIRPLTVELLQLLRLTENDELTNVLQKIVCNFVNDIAPIAHDITIHLAHTFQQIMEGAGDVDGEKTIVAMGLLNAMETILVVMEDQPEVCLILEPILLQVVTFILDKSIMEFYEEAFSLISSLTEKQVSPAMWSIFEGMYRVIERDGVEYFVEMMPCLHNYITVDTESFLSDPNRLLAIGNILKRVLLDEPDSGEDAQCHAAKLIEVIILQCNERVRPSLPSLLQLALERLNQNIKTSELRTMCLQIVVAALFVDVQLTMGILSNVPNITIDAFVKQWLADTDCFLGLHDRKICVLGICTLLQSQTRPSALQEYSTQILPSLILLFDGLKRAYAAKALENADSDEEEETDEEEDDTRRPLEVDVLSSDEDEIDDEGEEYLEHLQKRIISNKKNIPFEMSTEICDDEETDEDDETEYSGEETALECYVTPLDDEHSPIDEFIIFKDVMLKLEMCDPNFYASMTNVLNEDQRKSVQDIFTLAEQRRAAAQSKEIEKRGGYEFQQQAVPSAFNFGCGGGPPPAFR